MTIKMSWAEAANVLKKHLQLEALQLGEPTLHSSYATYEGEDITVEFPILPKEQPVPEPCPIAAQPLDDVPF